MAKRYEPIDLTRLKTYSIGRRAHKFDAQKMAKPAAPGATFRQWWESLPPYLGASAMQKLATSIVSARKAERPVVWALGAHVVKVGCGPIVCDLIERGIVTAVAMNGATAIHDVEAAIFGQTSEEVSETLSDGRFGMVEETPAFFAEAIVKASSKDRGFGAALGEHLVRSKPKYLASSVLAAAQRAGIPATVHVALGTDTIHMHPAVADSDLAALSNTDFRIICSVVADMAPARGGAAAGVWCNVGSAVILPEVFLKAVGVARNLGANLDEITTANLDMIRHYRPSENVIGRPVKPGHGFQLIGHHEIMLPLLRQVIIETQA